MVKVILSPTRTALSFTKPNPMNGVVDSLKCVMFILVLISQIKALIVTSCIKITDKSLAMNL